MIHLDRLTVRSGTFTLADISLDISSGAYAVLMGRTGCGKTTLVEAICGLRHISAGRIVLCDRDVTRLRPADRGVGYVPQDLVLFPTLTVRDNMGFALHARHWSLPDIAARVEEMAELLGITHLLGRHPQGLSGGESQRVALGRALAFRPRVLLLDEPLSALDEDTRAEMVDLLRSVQRITGVTVLHITHSRAEATRLADRLFVFDRTGVREETPP